MYEILVFTTYCKKNTYMQHLTNFRKEPKFEVEPVMIWFLIENFHTRQICTNYSICGASFRNLVSSLPQNWGPAYSPPLTNIPTGKIKQPKAN